jgi:hypothetical protein
MCFHTEKPARVKKAKTDIECWKVLTEENRPFYFTEYPPYEKGVVNPKIKLLRRERIIEKGYHSFKTRNVSGCRPLASNQVDEHPETFKKFIIPAGTKYYENNTEYVSETIMLVE